MKRFILIAMMGLSACAKATTEAKDNIWVDGVEYKVRAVDGGIWTGHGNQLISGMHDEVQVDGIWYWCHGDCAQAVRDVIANKAALVAANQAAASATSEEDEEEDRSGGGGGY